MAPLHRTLSFQISEAFNGMINNKKQMQTKHGYYFNGSEIDNENNLCWFPKTLTKSLSCDFQKDGKLHASYNTINRASSIFKRFGEINYNVSYF